jgi:hypothetical protein
MDVRRVVQLWVRDPGGPDRIGSGYLLTDSVVLTAAHVLGPPTAGRDEGMLAADDVLVQSHWNAGRTVPASRVLRLGGDIAVLIVDRPFVDPLGPAPVRGTLGSAALVLPAVVVGYPELELQQRPEEGSTVPESDGSTTGESYRRDRQLDGEISGGTGFGDGTLTVHLVPRLFPHPGAGQPGRSVFMGLSGAAIFIGGHLVGVITEDPHPDHPTVVLGQRLDPVARHLKVPASMSGSISATACGALFGPAVDVSVTAGARAVREAHLWQARTILENIPGGRLRDRGLELSQMAGFCADTATGYLVWHAKEWSGKSALLATFVAEPPAGTDIVAFFINRNDADARTADRYLASVINQLEAYLDGPHEAVNVAVPGAAAGRYRDLLARAAAAARDSARRLVLVVDALDEDDAFTPHPDQTSPIAELLPAHIAGLHVIVATRPYEHVLTAMPAHHPFRTAMPVPLSASPHAADIRDEAAREVRKTATGTDPVARSILAFLQVAEDELTPAELAELTSHLPGNGPAVTPAAIRARLQTGLHRTVWQRVRADEGAGRGVTTTGKGTYGWAHATLPQMVMDQFGPTLINTHAEALHRWADEHYRRGWSSDTPHYLETGYPRLLSSAGRTALLTAYALDRTRHSWLHARRGGNDQALYEIGQAAGLLARSVPLNVGTLVLLAFERDRLQEQYGKLPIGIPAVWAMLGNIHRAEVLAHSMPTQNQPQALAGVARALAAAGNTGEAERVAGTITGESSRAWALAGVARALAAAGNTGEAERVAGAAERIVGTIANEYLRAEALTGIANALAAAGNTGEAERVAGTITDEAYRAEALAGVTGALAAAGNTGEAERVASTIANEYRRAEALAGIAGALAAAGNTGEAERVAGAAERVAGTITDEDDRARALAGIANALAAAGHAGEAERVAGTITGEDYRAEALAGIAGALAAAGHAGEAERFAGTIANEYRRAEALAGIAGALAAAGHAGEAERVAGTIANEYLRAEALAGIANALAAAGHAGEAERVAGTITGEAYRAEALTGIAGALAAAGHAGEAERVAGAAERIVGTIANEYRRAEALTGIAGALAAAGHAGEAERVAGTITGETYRAEALAGIANALAAAGNTGEAERVAGTITGEAYRTEALAGIANALAAAGNTGEAERVAGAAERVAGTITNENGRAGALAGIANALAAAGNTGEAERVAGTITGETYRAEALAGVTGALAAAGNTGEAERVAGTITNEDDRAEALTGIAGALAAAGNTDEAERVAGAAERVAGTITNEDDRAEALTGIANALATAGNTDEAERVAGTITGEKHRTWALTGIANALAAAGHAGEAERFAGAAERVAGTITDESSREPVLAGVAGALAAAGNTGEAERVVGTITNETYRTWALTRVARALAAAGHAGEAERVAGTIAGEYVHAEALTGIANALAAAGHAGEAERVAGAAERIAGTIDENHRAPVLVEVANALAAAGNTGEAERVGCQVLLTDRWPLAIKTLLGDRLVKAAVNPIDGWLNSEWVAELIAPQNHSGSPFPQRDSDH